MKGKPQGDNEATTHFVQALTSKNPARTSARMLRISRIVFTAKLGDATNEATKGCWRSVSKVHWWILIAAAAGAGLLVYGLYRWAAGAPGIDDEIAKEHFRKERDWRDLRRSDENSARSTFSSRDRKS